MTATFNLTRSEIATIYSWYEYATDDSFHYGGAQLQLPSEQLLLEKLSTAKTDQFVFSRSEIDMITDWMERCIHRKYGSEKYLFGYEQQLYFKIKSTADSLVY